MIQNKVKHSPISPSSMERIWQCPGSRNLIAKIKPPYVPSIYASEGTVAHKILEHMLSNKLTFDVGMVVKQDGFDITVTQEMIDAVLVAYNYIKEQTAGLELLLETKLTVKNDHGLPMYGYADVCAVNPFGRLFVYDYKHGVGVSVDIHDNKQLLYYAVGALDSLPDWMLSDVDTVVIGILQPRVKDGNGIKCVAYPTVRVQEFKKELIAKVLESSKPDAPLTPGDWCKTTFCPVAAQCPAIKKEVAVVVGAELDQSNQPHLPPANILTPDQIAAILDKEDMVVGWLKEIRRYAGALVDAGAVIPGYGWTCKRANRKWKDEKAAAVELVALLGDKAYTKSLISLTTAEKLLKDKDITHLWYKPEGEKVIGKVTPEEVIDVTTLFDSVE